MNTARNFLLMLLCLTSPLSNMAQETSAGERLFLQNCAECHQKDGKGLKNVYPALAGSEVVQGSGVDVALVLIIGRGEMPSFAGAISNSDMALIINYVRNSWENTGELITEDVIESLQ